jgi:hypothetical protein
VNKHKHVSKLLASELIEMRRKKNFTMFASEISNQHQVTGMVNHDLFSIKRSMTKLFGRVKFMTEL